MHSNRFTSNATSISAPHFTKNEIESRRNLFWERWIT
jgi:hypothetical protein